MQVERDPIGSLLSDGFSGERVSNTWATCPRDRDNMGKPVLIPDILPFPHGIGRKWLACYPLWEGPAAY
jgi:hypothetical protein